MVRLVDHLHWSGLSAGARSLIEKRIDSVNCEIAILKKAIEIGESLESHVVYSFGGE